MSSSVVLFEYYGRTWFADVNEQNVYVYRDEDGEDLDGQYFTIDAPKNGVQRKAISVLR